MIGRKASDLFHERSSALVLDALETLPHIVNAVIVFEVEVCFQIFRRALGEHPHDLVDHHEARAAVCGNDADQRKIDDFRLFHRFENAEDRGQRQVSVRFLDRHGDGGEAQPEADGVLVLVEQHGDMLHVDDDAEIFDEFLFHLLRKGNGAVNFGVCIVEQAEEIVLIPFDELAGVFGVAHSRAVP